MTSLEALQDLRDVKGWSDENYFERLDIIEKDLKDLEWLKSKLNFTFLNSLTVAEDKERVMDIVYGVTYDYQNL